MLATLVIGLREGLEASLIVGIIAAFLTRSGARLRPMWIGVAVAIALSITVGVVLQLVSASLPQAQQEGMESVIALVAVVAVTGMIGWMSTHARTMRTDLEQHTALALRNGTAGALVGMAFLAVLKEGFETSVFLLAAFQSSSGLLGAGAGAVLGIAVAVAIGVLIFRGGVRLNLARFFRLTGGFLVLVAAGLVLSSLRTAHEAGWIQIGQQRTVGLAWLAPTGSVQAALLTGVLGIPSDPRLIEVLGWFAYLVPTMLFLLWPLKRRPAGRALATMRLAIAAALAGISAVLALAITIPTYAPPATATVRSADGTTSTISVPTDLATARRTTRGGIAAHVITTTTSDARPDAAPTVTLDQLVALSGGRLPIGVNAVQNPGPYTAVWRTRSTASIWIVDGGILDAQRSSTTVVTLTGGGLATARTISPDGAQTGSWSMPASARTAIANRITATEISAAELLLWKLWIPVVLALTALVLLLCVLRSQRRGRPRRPHERVRENYA